MQQWYDQFRTQNNQQLYSWTIFCAPSSPSLFKSLISLTSDLFSLASHDLYLFYFGWSAVVPVTLWHSFQATFGWILLDLTFFFFFSIFFIWVEYLRIWYGHVSSISHFERFYYSSCIFLIINLPPIEVTGKKKKKKRKNTFLALTIS